MIETDALIIGKGPAGIQASVYLKRGNVDPIVIGKGYGASEQAEVIDNFYGFTSIGGVELIERGIEQARSLGIDVVDDEVTSISFDGEGYVVTTINEEYRAMSLMLATGSHRNVPRIRKIRNYAGKGVSYCAVCDAFFYRNKTVAVVGSAEYAAHEASELVEIVDKVYVLTNGEALSGTFDERCVIIDKKVKSVYGNEKVEGVEFEDQSTLELEGLFVAIGSATSTDLANKLGVYVENGRIVVNAEMETNLPGLYAAGDCTPGVQQIARAVSDGCVGGMNMISYIRNKKRGK
ncbi:NAD(P)/FAD-dependent oxidoreductase [Erysipelothrix inopinata]|uniref:NAD(P)/FAD-dependent oxidoreductase n=1 Tax=Erysipelothrix inopinata TaxID=225084 RepID=A0A7G9S1H5_9FIRM|nr:NAD(P)/FAD-dependent oxidoreductase [Erysipelothrix inopinata]QNN61700.1 NAD(P)/FAD-dependent oxidoreductase [Erysipelothrix inopinata]